VTTTKTSTRGSGSRPCQRAQERGRGARAPAARARGRARGGARAAAAAAARAAAAVAGRRAAPARARAVSHRLGLPASPRSQLAEITQTSAPGAPKSARHSCALDHLRPVPHAGAHACLSQAVEAHRERERSRERSRALIRDESESSYTRMYARSKGLRNSVSSSLRTCRMRTPSFNKNQIEYDLDGRTASLRFWATHSSSHVSTPSRIGLQELPHVLCLNPLTLHTVHVHSMARRRGHARAPPTLTIPCTILLQAAAKRNIRHAQGFRVATGSAPRGPGRRPCQTRRRPSRRRGRGTR